MILRYGECAFTQGDCPIHHISKEIIRYWIYKLCVMSMNLRTQNFVYKTARNTKLHTHTHTQIEIMYSSAKKRFIFILSTHTEIRIELNLILLRNCNYSLDLSKACRLPELFRFRTHIYTNNLFRKTWSINIKFKTTSDQTNDTPSNVLLCRLCTKNVWYTWNRKAFIYKTSTNSPYTFYRYLYLGHTICFIPYIVYNLYVFSHSKAHSVI